MPRVTNNYLKDLINEYLSTKDYHFNCNEVCGTRYTQSQYEEGACKHIVNFVTNENNAKCYFYALIFDTKKEIEKYISLGAKIEMIRDRAGSFEIRFK